MTSHFLIKSSFVLSIALWGCLASAQTLSAPLPATASDLPSAAPPLLWRAQSNEASRVDALGKSPLPDKTDPMAALKAKAAGNSLDAKNASNAQELKALADKPALPELAVTKFQLFVEQTSGKQLPLHGYNLFAGNRFQSLTDVPVPANYVIGPGDEIDIKIWGVTDLALRVEVDRNGQISLPKVGTFNLSGTRSDQLEAVLKGQVQKVLRNFELNATVGRLRSVQIFMVGQARQPGAYMVSSLSTLIGALFEAGGPAATGSLRGIQLVRAGKTITTLDLYKFIHSGDTSQDARLLPGDVIVIPPAGPRVALMGALENAAVYELSPASEKLSQLLTFAGGQPALISPHRVQLERIDAQQDQGPRSVQNLALDATGLATPLRGGDVLTLFPISPEFSNAVTLRGNVARPLRYAHRPGMRVSDLIPEQAALIQGDYHTRKNRLVQYESGTVATAVTADRVLTETRNLLEEINWDYATIERPDLKNVKTQLIPFNLGKAIRQQDPAHNLVLLPGDVLTVFGVKELPVPIDRRTQFVRVGGEVQVPGVYELRGGETLLQLIERAGGLTANAYLYGTVFTRESARAQQQENLSKALRKMEADVASQSASIVQNAPEADKAQVAQAQLASQRGFIDRLRGLKASGRVSLEMDPAKPVLPDLRVEDEDQITVPARPSFVGVYGAVMTESAMIHRPQHTLGDYLNKAGITRDADMDELMLIRADGTVEGQSAKAQGGGNWSSRWFSGGLLSKTLFPGDTIFVPEVVDRRSSYTQFIQGLKDWTQIVSQMGLGAVAIKTLRQ